jgi:hypothetical protein
MSVLFMAVGNPISIHQFPIILQHVDFEFGRVHIWSSCRDCAPCGTYLFNPAKHFWFLLLLQVELRLICFGVTMQNDKLALLRPGSLQHSGDNLLPFLFEVATLPDLAVHNSTLPPGPYSVVYFDVLVSWTSSSWCCRIMSSICFWIFWHCYHEMSNMRMPWTHVKKPFNRGLVVPMYMAGLVPGFV